jgi:glycosyltransferase involved in cell wall biosynthesis
MPKISVLISVLNGEKYLAQAIESILSQTFGEFEFLIMDDGSTDSTPSILAHYAQQDNRIRLFRHATRQGVASSSNELLELARCDWIARLDADDIALPHRLQAQWTFVQTHPKTVLLGGGIQHIDEHGKLLPHIWIPYDGTARSAWELCFANNFPHSATFYRRDVALQVGGYEIRRFGEEYRLWVRCIGKGELHTLQQVVTHYRIHQQSATALDIQENEQVGEMFALTRLRGLLGNDVDIDEMRIIRRAWREGHFPPPAFAPMMNAWWAKLLIAIRQEVGEHTEAGFERGVAKRLLFLYGRWAGHRLKHGDPIGAIRILAHLPLHVFFM